MAIIYEIGDAPWDEGTPYTMEPGDAFRGTLDVDDTSHPYIDDHVGGDFIRIDLNAGTTYEFNLTGSGFFPVDDPYLYLRDSNGNIVAFDDDDVCGLETIDERHGLCRDDDLYFRRHRAYQAADNVNGVGMQSEFRFVKNQHVRQIRFGLKEQGNKGDDSQHAVRRL